VKAFLRKLGWIALRRRKEAGARRLETVGVDARFFDVLGVQPVIGRTFDRSENDPGNTRVVVLRAELFDVSLTDPAAFAGVAFVLTATSLVASLLPVWRAVRADPLVALRAE